MVIIIQRHYAFLYLLAVLSVLLLCLIPLANFPLRAVRTESNAPITPLYKEGIIILMYHDVNFDTTVEGTIDPVLFEAQMTYLAENGFHIVSLEKLHAFLWHKAPLPPQAILITFDDGYQNIFRYAYPILTRYNFSAVVFTIVATADEKYSPHLNWEQMKEMTQSGLISFQSHTYACHKYGTVDPQGKELPVLMNRLYSTTKGKLETEAEYSLRIRGDLQKAKNFLEQKLGTAVNSLAFPYGFFNETILEIAGSLGYQNFFTVKSGINRPLANQTLPLLKRISAGESYMTVENLKRYLALAATKDEQAGALFAAIVHK